VAAGPDLESRKGEVYHGGDLAAASLRFPAAPRPWLDLSTGVNPVAYPVGRLSDEAWTRLPDPGAIAGLEAVAASVYGAREAAMLVAAPGAQALIQWLPRLVAAERVGILGFTYAEHEACWRAAGKIVSVVADIETLAEADVAVVVNPNNPDGRRLPPDALAALARRLAAKGGALIVDEAFMDAEPAGLGLAPTLPDGAIVLRSFGKLYGLAGLRLGFALAAPERAARLRQALGPWRVSGPAIDIGSRALADPAWRQAAILRLRRDAARLDALLAGAGFEPAGGTPLFRLAQHRDAATWFARLGSAGILARPFQARCDWLRFGLPGAEADWRRLRAVLGER